MTKPVQIINDYWLKEVILNGNPSLDKFYKEDLIRMINILKQENQKYKKVINKIYEITNYEYDFYDSIEDIVNDLENILKEVEDK